MGREATSFWSLIGPMITSVRRPENAIRLREISAIHLMIYFAVVCVWGGGGACTGSAPDVSNELLFNRQDLGRTDVFVSFQNCRCGTSSASSTNTNGNTRTDLPHTRRKYNIVVSLGLLRSISVGVAPCFTTSKPTPNKDLWGWAYHTAPHIT